MIKLNHFITKFILFNAILNFVSEINAEQPEKIIGGVDVPISDYPYMASLKIHNSHHCGGIIISDHHILTAAHCIRSMKKVFATDPSAISVTTGTSMRTGTKMGEQHNVSDMLAHEFFPGPDGVNYDIGVIKLSKSLKFNKLQKPIELAKDDTPPNSKAEIIGWGLTDWDKTVSPIFLQMAPTVIISDKVCRALGVDLQSKHSTLMCAFGGKGRGICPGDSGGPLVYNGVVVGISSRSLPCAKGVPDIFVKVKSFLDFIDYAMNTLK